MIIAFIVVGVIFILGSVILACVRVIENAPENKGTKGERIVTEILQDHATRQDRILNNVIFKNSQNGTSQIDHIYISSQGIFVIETKNYSGKIYGNDNQREWTQVLNYGKTKNKFYSPVKQNFTHVFLIKKLLQKDFPIFNVVVFVQGNTEYIDSEYVYTLRGLKDLLTFSPRGRLTEEQIERVYNTLLIREDFETTEEEHVANIQTTQYKIANNICPRCNAKLILRDGKYGQFYGCSNYPKCKFTKEL